MRPVSAAPGSEQTAAPLEPAWFRRGGAALTLLAIAIAVPFREEGLSLVVGLALALLLTSPALRRLWWRVFAIPGAVAVSFLVVLALHSLAPATSLAGLPYLLGAVVLTLPALALAALPAACFRRALGFAIVVLLALCLDLYLRELSQVGWSQLRQLTGLNSVEHRNSVAALFSIGIIYCVVAISLSARNLPALILPGIALVLFALMGYLNNSRGGMLGALAAIPLVFLRAYPLRTLAVAGLLAALIGVGYVAGPLRHVLQHNGSLDNGRNRIWSAFMDRAAQSPVLGLGNDTYLVDPGLREQHPEIAPLYYPHSIYTDLVYSSGFAGLVFWAGWLSWLSLRASRLLRAGNMAVIGLGGALLVYIAVHGLVDLTFYSFGVLGLLVLGTTLFSLGRQAAPDQGH